MVATLPEAPSFTVNGLNGSVSPERGVVERGALLVLSVILSGSLFNTFSFRGFSLSCSLKVFQMNG